MRHEFLQGCHSKPLTVGDLKVGDLFIVFPTDGDDSGHGGFKGGKMLLEKIDPVHPGEGYHESFLYTCKEYERGFLSHVPLIIPVIKIYGIEKKHE